MGDRSTNQHSQKIVSRQLNEREDDKSTLSKINTDVDDNPEEMENLETVENTKQSTQTRIPIKLAEGVI